MKYTFRSVLGEESTHESIDFIKEVLDKPFEDWKMGAGDSSIVVNEGAALIFFKTREGIFIMQHPDYLAPKIGNSPVHTVEHYVGGEPMEVPNVCLVDNDLALKIFERYIIDGTLLKACVWGDFVEMLELR